MLSERGLGTRGNPLKQGWENSDFPILCEGCLGDNPYVRMLKKEFGKECKICFRPFTCFRWKAGTQGRYKETMVCQTCAKLKNVCQTCLFDLEFGLSVELRDKLLDDQKVNIPTQMGNREFWIEHASKHIDNLILPYNQSEQSQHQSQGQDQSQDQQQSQQQQQQQQQKYQQDKRAQLLKKVQHLKPNYSKNQAHVCTFFLKGECKRGVECPYLHSERKYEEKQNIQENIQKRYLGEATEQSVKYMLEQQLKRVKKPRLPTDPLVTTLLLKDFQAHLTKQDLTLFLQQRQVQLQELSLNKKIFILNFKHRYQAEDFVDNFYNKLKLKEKVFQLCWERKEEEEELEDEEDGLLVPTSKYKHLTSHSVQPPVLPPPEFHRDLHAQHNLLLTLINTPNNKYPSMNPNTTGGKINKKHQ